ncbi:MAG: T9SS type A sorting domain-containing protein [Flavobacteriales bacterium]|nr:T9SS type A sorting domain-containing protein [Flavobacteriales bacterium]
MRYPILAVFVFLLTLTTSSQVHEVPADFNSIQVAIDASNSGDTIHIAPGTYVENLVIPHELTMLSDYFYSQDESDINTTILDGDSMSSVIRAINPSGTKLELIGLTVQNGSGYPYPVFEFQDTLYLNFGGGLHIIGVDQLILDHMVIRQNEILTDHNSGGGLFAENCSVVVRESTIEENQVQGGSFFGEGAGLCFYTCDVHLENSTIQNNYALPGYAEGAGIFAKTSEVTMDGVEVLNNTGPNSAALNFSASNAQLNNCLIEGNTATFTQVMSFTSYNEDVELIIQNCDFVDNHGNQGGTFSILGAHAEITGTTFLDNTTSFGPLCLNISQSDFLLSNCSFMGGFCASQGSLSCDAGALKTWQSTGSIVNTVMAENNPSGVNGFSEGGAIDFSQSTIIMDSLIVRGNIGNEGGGIRASGSDLILRNSAVVNNQSEMGGGIMSIDSNWHIDKSTIAGNSGSQGNGIWTYSDSLVVTNSIVWNENGDELFANASQYNDTSLVRIAYSTVRGSEANFANIGYIETIWLEGNMETQPIFENPVEGNYQLAAGALQIDAGTAFFELDGEVIVDLQNYLGSAPDMGYSETMVTHIQQEALFTFTVFPNPTQHQLLIAGPTELIELVCVFGMNGQLLMNQGVGCKVINLDSMNSGIYELVIRSQNGIECHRVVKL